MSKTCLRYPGGKSKQSASLANLLGDSPRLVSLFTGGGGVEMRWLSEYPERKLILNDANRDVAMFWQFLAQGGGDHIARRAREILESPSPLKLKWQWLRHQPSSASRFFCLNRLSFNGLCDRGGMGNGKRFTQTSIERLGQLGRFVAAHNVVVHGVDYRVLLSAVSSDDLVFGDPPYPSAVKSDLYGDRHNSLHRGFEMEEFRDRLRRSPTRWVITVDGTEVNHSLFHLGALYRFSVQVDRQSFPERVLTWTLGIAGLSVAQGLMHQSPGP